MLLKIANKALFIVSVEMKAMSILPKKRFVIFYFRNLALVGVKELTQAWPQYQFASSPYWPSYIYTSRRLIFSDHFFILITFAFVHAVILLGEVRCWSLLGLKGLRGQIRPVMQ